MVRKGVPQTVNDGCIWKGKWDGSMEFFFYYILCIVYVWSFVYVYL